MVITRDQHGQISPNKNSHKKPQHSSKPFSTLHKSVKSESPQSTRSHYGRNNSSNRNHHGCSGHPHPTPPQLSDLTRTILSHTHHHHRRLSSLLSSPILFSLTLHRLNCLPLAHKTLLIANHLLSSLHHLTLHFQPYTNLPPRQARQRDLDAVLLLLLLCEVHQHNPQALEAPNVKWREILSDLYSDNMLTVSGIGVYNGSALVSYIEVLTRCLRFVSVMGFCCGGKAGREVAASPAVVVSLPSVVVSGGGSECVICKEEMREHRDVCELPCRHLFHWMCILRWLRKRNTCPCCRFTLPTDDVFGEIQRLWEILVKIGEKELA